MYCRTGGSMTNLVDATAIFPKAPAYANRLSLFRH
jgi:hypothetical protein